MLTKRQKQILDYIEKFVKEKDYAPSLEEIRRHFKLAKSTVHQHIETLRVKGYLNKIENQPRSIELNQKKKISDLVEIPLLGTIAAGEPIEVFENKETIEVPKSQLSKSGEHFALRVSGDSMINEGIFDGSTVIIRKQPDAENGETVVALINGNEVTLKKIYKEKDGFRLQPANPALKPIFVKELEIQGKVVSVIRSFEELKKEVSIEKKKIIHQHQVIDLPKDVEPLVIFGDVIEKLKMLPDKSINCVVTSPPYWGQRDYGMKGQIGNEETSEEYIKKMLNVAKELKRILTDDGAYFLNIGDKYIDKNLKMIPFELAIEMQKLGWAIRNVIIWKKTNAMPSSIKDRFSNIYEPIFLFVKNPDNYLTPEYYFDLDSIRIPHKNNNDEKEKSSRQKTLLLGGYNQELELPLTLSIEEYEKWKNKISNNKNGYNGKFKNTNKINLGASPGARMSVYGEFYSRQRKHKINSGLELEIIHFIKNYRKNKGISSKKIDKIFGYKDTAGHWFRTDKGGRCLPKPDDWSKLKDILGIKDDRYDKIMIKEHYVLQTVKPHELGKNPGDVWDFATGKLQDSHFAIFPEELPKRAILSCCPENGIVLDPFAGSGTSLKVAKELNRKSIGIELQKDYLNIIRKRCGKIKIL